VLVNIRNSPLHIIGEFLSDWTRAHGPRMELLKVISEDSSPRGHKLRLFLERNGIPHGVYLAGSAPGQSLLNQIGLRQFLAHI
jgi:hypothetical protein